MKLIMCATNMDCNHTESLKKQFIFNLTAAGILINKIKASIHRSGNVEFISLFSFYLGENTHVYVNGITVIGKLLTCLYITHKS